MQAPLWLRPLGRAMPEMDRSVIVGIDVGGTFTDILALDQATGQLRAAKVASHAGAAVGRPSSKSLAAMQLPLASVAQFVHGTTIATNAVLERKLARTALITTKRASVTPSRSARHGAWWAGCSTCISSARARWSTAGTVTRWTSACPRMAAGCGPSRPNSWSALAANHGGRGDRGRRDRLRQQPTWTMREEQRAKALLERRHALASPSPPHPKSRGNAASMRGSRPRS